MLARRRARGYPRSVLRPVRLLLAALALLALGAAGALADEPSHGRAKKTRTHHRRPQAQKPAGRGPRGGAPPALAKVKRPPAEKAESIGSPNDGHLKGGAHLDMSKPYLRTVPVYESGDVNGVRDRFMDSLRLQQLDHMDRSLEYCRRTLNLGQRWRS